MHRDVCAADPPFRERGKLIALGGRARVVKKCMPVGSGTVVILVGVSQLLGQLSPSWRAVLTFGHTESASQQCPPRDLHTACRGMA